MNQRVTVRRNQPVAASVGREVTDRLTLVRRRRAPLASVAISGTLGAAAALAGCGMAPAAMSHPAAARPVVHVVHSDKKAHSLTTPIKLAPPTNLTLAEIDARYLMSSVRLPRRASPPSRTPPKGTPQYLRHPAVVAWTPYLAKDSLFTIIPGPPDAVIAWFATHAPKGSRDNLSGSLSGTDAIELSQGFGWPANAVLRQRELIVSAETFDGHMTLVRIDTGVVYTPNRPQAESVPAAIDRVVLTVTPPKGPARIFTVTKAASISVLEAALAALARPDYTSNPGGPCLCGPGINERFTAAFYLAGETTPSVTVSDSPMFAEMGVGNVEFTVGAAAEPILEDGSWSVAKVVERLTGVRFDGVPPG
jgi:hypothetical protein